MLSKQLETTINRAFVMAQRARHQLCTVEHLLLALLEDSAAVEVLQACNADSDRLRDDLQAHIAKNTPVHPSDATKPEVKPTLSFHRVIRRAVFHVQSSGRPEVTGANVLVAIFGENESDAAYFLQKQNVARLDMVNFIAHGITKDEHAGEGQGEDEDFEDDGEARAVAGSADREKEDDGALKRYASNLNDLAREGRIDPLIGRSAELERVIRIMARRRKNNPLLVGESGVGKTAIAEGLAKMIVEKKVPEVIEDAVVYALDMGSLLAGTKYRGDFEKRFKGLLSEICKTDKGILFIDEIHTVIGAGATNSGVLDASNLLKPLLTGGEMRCIGSTTYKEYRHIFEKDHALSRRFQKVDVLEPSIEETYRILQGLKSRFEEHHGLRYNNKALRAAADLAGRFINDRFLPDKAIDLMDEAGAQQQLSKPSKRKKVIGQAEMEKIVAVIARIPEKTVSSSDKKALAKLEDDLKRVVFGQDQAIANLVSAIKLARAGLRPEAKPVGSFLFAGPTGVGKTEVSRQLAMTMGVELVRFDMSEYMERHTVSRLIGAPPGYVGYDQGGLLTEAITQNPHSVLLFDEIEKAHPEVFNLLLQVMDHGTLTDNNGRKADFRNVIIIMTTNAGAQEMSRASMGFTEQDHSSDTLEVIKRLFSPEFRNRLDTIIQFGVLSRDTIITVVDKFLVELQVQLDDKKVQLEVDDAAREWLADRGYDPKMGARPMQRLIQDSIKKPLADQVLFGELAERGGEVRVRVQGDGLYLETRAKPGPGGSPGLDRQSRDRRGAGKMGNAGEDEGDKTSEKGGSGEKRRREKPVLQD